MSQTQYPGYAKWIADLAKARVSYAVIAAIVGIGVMLLIYTGAAGKGGQLVAGDRWQVWARRLILCGFYVGLAILCTQQ